LGAARGAGLGAGIFKNRKEMFRGLKKIATIEPDKKLSRTYAGIYKRWKTVLEEELSKHGV
jgi:xylulokinase